MQEGVEALLVCFLSEVQEWEDKLSKASKEENMP